MNAHSKVQVQTQFKVPLIIRGRIIEGDDLTFSGRRGEIGFSTPDVVKHLSELPTSGRSMRDLYDITLDDIIAFMAEVGKALDFEKNPWLAEAYELSCITSGLPRSILARVYSDLPDQYKREVVEAMVETQVGRAHLDGWVHQPLRDNRTLSIRAFGARSVHIIAGNSPGVAFLTVLRSAITRSDTIIKLPSNDPLTAAAVVRTMIEVDPDHPITRHTSVAYWKGGDEKVENAIYTPRNVEKIVAWGGFDSVKHITRYLQPGIDLITLDPKHSGSIIGRQAFASEMTMMDAARRAAWDVGGMNQELCANARVIYVECDSADPVEMERLNRFGQMILHELGEMPSGVSSPSKYVDGELQAELEGLTLQEDFYRIFQDHPKHGAVIVSQFDEPVEFASMLANRTANLVPVASVDDAVSRINASSQTIGVYPASLANELSDALAIQGAQHLVPLGEVIRTGFNGPQDAIETERRMLKWVRRISGPTPGLLHEETMNRSIKVRKHGNYENQAIIGFFEETMESSNPEARKFGLNIDAVSPNCMVYDEDGAMWNLTRFASYGSTLGLRVNTNSDGRKMYDTEHPMKDRAFIGPVAHRIEGGSHVIEGLGVPDKSREPFYYRRTTQEIEWHEGDILSLTGKRIGPAISWFNFDEDGGWGFSAYLSRISGTVMGKKVEGFSEFSTVWTPPGVSFGPLYFEKGASWLLACNDYGDGQFECVHLGVLAKGAKFAMIENQDGPVCATTEFDFELVVDDVGYPEEMNYTIDGERWEWRPREGGDIGNPSKPLHRDREGVLRRVGDTREPQLTMGWVNFFYDSRLAEYLKK
jgi:hypothetical protein